jgi:hypothetical protein
MERPFYDGGAIMVRAVSRGRTLMQMKFRLGVVMLAHWRGP